MITEKCSGFPYVRQAGREWVAVCLWNFNRHDCCIRKERVLVIQVTKLLAARLCRIERTARNWCTGSKVHLHSLNTAVLLCIDSAVCFGNILLSSGVHDAAWQASVRFWCAVCHFTQTAPDDSKTKPDMWLFYTLGAWKGRQNFLRNIGISLPHYTASHPRSK